jgi:hypothetical protein
MCGWAAGVVEDFGTALKEPVVPRRRSAGGLFLRRNLGSHQDALFETWRLMMWVVVMMLEEGWRWGKPARLEVEEAEG